MIGPLTTILFFAWGKVQLYQTLTLTLTLFLCAVALNVIGALAALGGSGTAAPPVAAASASAGGASATAGGGGGPGAAAIRASGASSLRASPQGAFALDTECLARCRLPPNGGDLSGLPPAFQTLFGLS